MVWLVDRNGDVDVHVKGIGYAVPVDVLVNETDLVSPGRSAVSGNQPMATDHCRVDFVESLKLAGTVLAALIASRTIWSVARAKYLKGWGSRKVWRRKQIGRAHV